MKRMPTQRWQEMMEAASEELVKWRQDHDRATFTSLEQEVDGQLAKVRRQILQDMALASERADIKGLEKEKRPTCQSCGKALSSEGKQKRKLTTEHEQQIELERSYASCPKCGESFFPSG